MSRNLIGLCMSTSRIKIEDIVKTLYWTGVKEAGKCWLDSTPSLSPGNWKAKHNLIQIWHWTLRYLSKRVSINTATSSWRTHRSPACRSHPVEQVFIQIQRRHSELSKKLNMISSLMRIFVTCTTCGAGVKFYSMVSKYQELTCCWCSFV